MWEAILAFNQWISDTGGKGGILTRLNRENEELKARVKMLEDQNESLIRGLQEIY